MMIKLKNLKKMYAPIKKNPHSIKHYEIWIGNRPSGQGLCYKGDVEKIGEIDAMNFKVACYKFLLKQALSSMEQIENNGEYLDNQACKFDYNAEKNSTGWDGTFYETEEEAVKSWEQ